MTDGEPTGGEPTPNIAANVKAAREARGWSQRDLARELSARDAPINQAALSRLEKGERDPRFVEVKALANVFGVSMEDLDTDPSQFGKSLEWTALRGMYSDARRDLKRASEAYERAANTLMEYLEFEHPDIIPEDVRDVLRKQAGQSCAQVALDRYFDVRDKLAMDPNQKRHGRPWDISPSDPAYEDPNTIPPF